MKTEKNLNPFPFQYWFANPCPVYDWTRNLELPTFVEEHHRLLMFRIANPEDFYGGCPGLSYRLCPEDPWCLFLNKMRRRGTKHAIQLPKPFNAVELFKHLPIMIPKRKNVT